MMYRRRCCCRNLLYVLMSLILTTCAVILYETQWSHQTFLSMRFRLHTYTNSTAENIVSNLSVIHTNSSMSVHETTCNTSCDFYHIKINLTTCVGCLRPGVFTFTNETLSEIEVQDGISDNFTDEYFQLKSVIIQEVFQNYLLVPQFNCSNVYLLAVQLSVMDKQHERDVVRNTWGSVVKELKWPNRRVNANVKIVFVVAWQGVSAVGNVTQQMTSITTEADMHKDILFIDMMDSYDNLTLKVMSAFKWVKESCPLVTFVLKVDYDTFVNVPFLMDTLLYFENRFEFSILGAVYWTNIVRRSGKWAISSNLYPYKLYPPHASGCGYVMSIKVLNKIVEAAPYILMFPIEDAFITGVMRIVIGCKMFSLSDLFTYRDDRSWYLCKMLQDKKILGTSKEGEGESRHSMIWASFNTNNCK